jgi:hypothetical protein
MLSLIDKIAGGHVTYVAEEIIAAGVAQGSFRPVEARTMAVLLMTIYLGTASQVDDAGRPWLDPAQVASFALAALRAEQPLAVGPTHRMEDQ